MIYLIMKIFVYLLIDLLAGIGAGWLLRNVAATKREEKAQRLLTEARARVPQFESLMRSRDDQVKRMRDEISGKERQIAELRTDIKAGNDALRDAQRDLKKVSAHSDALDLSSNQLANQGELDDSLVLDSAVSSESSLPSTAATERLERELADARASAADAVAEAAAAEYEVLNLRSQLAQRSGEVAADVAASAENSDVTADAVQELEARLRQKAVEFDRLSKALETEQRKVLELERERELQNKSLQVLHQQLELERERGQRAANG